MKTITQRELIDHCNNFRDGCKQCPYNHNACDAYVDMYSCTPVSEDEHHRERYTDDKIEIEETQEDIEVDVDSLALAVESLKKEMECRKLGDSCTMVCEKCANYVSNKQLLKSIQLVVEYIDEKGVNA